MTIEADNLQTFPLACFRLTATKNKMKTDKAKQLTQEEKLIIADLKEYFNCEYKLLSHSHDKLVNTLNKVLEVVGH